MNMNINTNENAIGVFDSGLGGLCAVREILKILPDEDIIYFGDTGRVPYGSRSYETIKKYARQDINFLLSKNVKIILIACGTVSSVAIDDLHREFPNVPILGIIESACEKSVKIAEHTKNKKIGVIGTQATIARGAFERYIKRLDNSCEVYGQACPLFVPLVENGHIHDGDMIAELTAEKYLHGLKKLNLSSLILGCTHYPMLKNIIGKVIKSELSDSTELPELPELIDAGAEAAHKLKQEMFAQNLLNGAKKGKDRSLKIFISDESMSFSEIASAFLGFDIKSGIYKINIEKY